MSSRSPVPSSSASSRSSSAVTTPALVSSGRTLSEPRLSPDGTALVFGATTPTGAQLIGVELGEGWPLLRGPEVQWTADPSPVGAHPFGGGAWEWLPDSSGVIYAARDGALYFVARGGGPSHCVVRPSRVGHRLGSPTISTDGWCAWVSDSGEQQVLEAAVLRSTSAGLVAGSVVVLVEGTAEDFLYDPHMGPRGLLAWHAWSVPFMSWDQSEIHAVRLDAATAQPIGNAVRFVAESDVSVAQPRWAPDGRTVGWVDDRSGWRNVCTQSIDENGHLVSGAPLRIDELFEHAEPTWGPGSRTWCWSPDATKVAFVRNEGGFGRLCLANVARTERRDPGEPVRELARAVHLGLSWSRTAGGFERIAAVRTGGKTPSQVVIYDVASGERVTIARGPVGAWDALIIREPDLVEWDASDGTRIHGRLYRPPGPDQAQPMVVLVHGGPTGQTAVTFLPRVVHLCQQGWNVFVPDLRGSSGWGRAYQRAMDGQWGVIDTDDVAQGIRHAIAQGWCDPNRIVAMGGSAGGFCALNLLRLHPDLFAGGVVLYPVTDLEAIDATTHRFERHYTARIVGSRQNNPNPYLDRSPIRGVESIVAPLLMFHGDADESVHVEQSRSIAARLRKLGRDVELIEYPGEGHGWKKPESTLDEVSRTDAFLRRLRDVTRPGRPVRAAQ